MATARTSAGTRPYAGTWAAHRACPGPSLVIMPTAAEAVGVRGLGSREVQRAHGETGRRAGEHGEPPRRESVPDDLDLDGGGYLGVQPHPHLVCPDGLDRARNLDPAP